MGLIVFVGVQIALYILLYLGVHAYTTDLRSYFVGVLHFMAIMVIGFYAPRLYFYFCQRGWRFDVRDWAARIRAQVDNDWVRVERGWDIDWVRVQMIRDHHHGTFNVCLAFVGVHLHVGVLVDEQEAALYRQQQEVEREAYIAGLPPQVQRAAREMMKNIPLGANIEVGAITGPMDDDEDDDAPPSKGIH